MIRKVNKKAPECRCPLDICISQKTLIQKCFAFLYIVPGKAYFLIFCSSWLRM